MENFRLLPADIINDLFVEPGGCDFNQILDIPTIDEIMQNETMHPDDASFYSGSYSGSPDSKVEWCYDNESQGTETSPSYNENNPAWEDFISDITSLNLPGMPLDGDDTNDKQCYLDLDASINFDNTNNEYNRLNNDIDNYQTVPNNFADYSFLPAADCFTTLQQYNIAIPQGTEYSCKPYIQKTDTCRPFGSEQKNTIFPTITPGSQCLAKKAYDDTLDKKESLQRQQHKGKHRKTRNQPNKCYHLWDFLLDILTGARVPERPCLEWTCEENREFRITDTKMLASLWGKCKNSKNMTYDKLSRTIRYYCTLDILKKSDGKRLQFKFSKGKMWSKV